MDKINTIFLQALKASLCNEKVDWNFEIQPEEWMRLFYQAETHHILPMIYNAVYNCPAAKRMDLSLWTPFKKKSVHQVMVQTIKTSEFLNLYQYLRESGVRPVMVKGVVCRELYPNPDYRISGDEDMLIAPGTFEMYHSKMLEYGMVAADANQDIREMYEIPYGKPGSPIYIELHKYLFPPDSKAYGEFNQFFEKIHEQVIEISVQGIPIATMNETAHFFYLICHAFKHFLHSGFGIRQVCDIVLFANRYGKEIEWLRVLDQCREIRAEKFTAALLQIGEKYLTFDPDTACYPAAWRNISVDETMMLEDLLDAGIYGAGSMSRKHSSNITLHAVSSQKQGKKAGSGVLKTIFPSAKNLQGRYPYLQKRPYFLPVAWADRILKYRKETGKVANDDAASAMEIGNRRVELLKKYNII